MSPRPAHEIRRPVAFRIAAIAALLASVVQISLGGVVRVTESGLGCPDWPLCHGRLIPPAELATLIEYSHRLSAAALGLLAVAMTALAWWSYRRANAPTVSATIALVLVFVAAGLGGASVLTELAWWVVLFHLGIAEAVLACLVIALVASLAPTRGHNHGAPGPEEKHTLDGRALRRLGWLVMSSVAATFALILLGSYMVGLGYGSSCATWPLCSGELLPDGQPYAVHMLHRYAAGGVGALLAWTALSAWSVRAPRPDLAAAAMLAAGLFLVQSLIGAATVWSGFASAMKATHLSVATLTWFALVLLAALLLAPRRPELRGTDDSAGRVMGLRRATT